MSWLTGPQITKEVNHKKITIHPYNQDQINPNSYDYTLAPQLKILQTNRQTKRGKRYLDPRLPHRYRQVTIPPNGIILDPSNSYLGYTQEVFGSNHFASLCTGKSSIGRLFIFNHICAGLIDIGFLGHITLEIIVHQPVKVYPGMRFGQMFWYRPYGNIQLYKGKYNSDSNRGMPSKIWQETFPKV